jgi:hypothetical protein
VDVGGTLTPDYTPPINTFVSFTTGGSSRWPAACPQHHHGSRAWLFTVEVAACQPAWTLGFNFDATVNPNDGNQGSLRQFILNSNALNTNGPHRDATPNGGLTLVAGIETVASS